MDDETAKTQVYDYAASGSVLRMSAMNGRTHYKSDRSCDAGGRRPDYKKLQNEFMLSLRKAPVFKPTEVPEEDDD